MYLYESPEQPSQYVFKTIANYIFIQETSMTFPFWKTNILQIFVII